MNRLQELVETEARALRAECERQRAAEFEEERKALSDAFAFLLKEAGATISDKSGETLLEFKIGDSLLVLRVYELGKPKPFALAAYRHNLQDDSYSGPQWESRITTMNDVIRVLALHTAAVSL